MQMWPLLLTWSCLLLLTLTVRAGSAEAEHAQAASKRDWNALHGGWGKRDSTELSDEGPEDERELMREVATGLVFPAYDPEDKRKWSSLTGSWGKRAKWNSFAGSWGKRSKWNDLGPSWGKRAKWDHFGGSWGKRGKWENFDGSWGKRAKWDNFGGSWGKRKNWDNFNGAWGKRKGWDSFSGGWGKRAAWNNFGGSWGKRDTAAPELEESSDHLKKFIVINYEQLPAEAPESSSETQAKKRKDWTQLNGMWGKRSSKPKSLLLA